MEMFSNNSNTTTPKRSFLLWFMAICTMVNAASSIYSYALYLISPSFVEQSLTTMQHSFKMITADQLQQMMDLFASIANWQYGLLILMQAAAFAGALIMLWKLNPIGFHVYTCSQIGLFVVQNMVIGGKLAMGFSDVFWTLMIILIYYMQMRYMRPAGEGGDGDSENNASDDSNNDIETIDEN